MKTIVTFILFLTFLFSGLAQQKKELFLKSFEADKFSFISVNSSYGNVYVQPSHDQLGARVEFIFSEEISKQAAKLIDNISVVESVRHDSLFITTQFDQSLFLKNNILWDIKDDINIEYRVKVPAKVKIDIKQKHGSVFAGRTSIPIVARLDNSGLYAKLTDKIEVHGSDFLVDASGVKDLTVNGSRGYLVLSNTQKGKLQLSYSTIESIGFNQVDADLENCAFSSGKTKTCIVKAQSSTIEFTDILEEASFDLTDVRFVVQKMPSQFNLSTLRGSSILSLIPGRNCHLNFSMSNSETELRLRGGSIRMDFKRKKTNIQLPESGTRTKQMAEFTQTSSHGIKIDGLFNRGQIIVKK